MRIQPDGEVPDSSPTPACGLGLQQLAERCRHLAREAERVALTTPRHKTAALNAAQRLGALAQQFAVIGIENPPDGAEHVRTALVSELSLLTESIRRMLGR